MSMDGRVEEILKRCISIDAISNLTDDEKESLRRQADKNNRLQSNNIFLGSTDKIKFFTFNLPRNNTCPGRTDICSGGCYQAIPEEMLKQEGRESQVVYSRRLNWFLAEQDDFVERMLSEIAKKRPKANQKIIIRIHASGDFYSDAYLEKWMKIALITKLEGMNYDFVAYTKSFAELDSVLSNQDRLQTMYKEASQRAKVEIEKDGTLSLSDFNIHIIASYMDDTSDDAKMIAEKWDLPVYFVTQNTKHELTDCEAEPCAGCMQCYTFPMQMVVTGLR